MLGSFEAPGSDLISSNNDDKPYVTIEERLDIPYPPLTDERP